MPPALQTAMTFSSDIAPATFENNRGTKERKGAISMVLHAILFLGLSLGPAGSQASGAPSPERRDILNYQLTLARANQLIVAMEAMTKYVVSQPDFADRLRK